MNWETQGISDDEAIMTNNAIPSPKKDLIREENEQKRLTQLQIFLDHKADKDTNKILYHSVMSHFGQLVISDNKEEIMKSILTDDCEIFLFNFANTTPAQYGFRYEGFANLFEGKRLIRREVKETYVSLKKATGFQICECEVIDENKGSSVSQFSFEIFSFRGNKLSKYRASYGSMPKIYDPQSLFITSKKERMMAKAKELNYAWADQPDLERIASLMHENTEHKIYRWKDKKCFTFDKHNIVSDFRKCLEDNYLITSVVPYGLSYEGQYIYGSYVYHLEGKHDLSGQKFVWVSTCIFSFDQNFNIKKISQQGDLFPEDEKLIPFQVQSKAELFKPPERELKKRFSIFDNEHMNFSSDLIVFGSSNSVFTGHVKGLSQIDILEKVISSREQITEKPKHVDIFEDLDDPCYESIIVLNSCKGIPNQEGKPFFGKPINFYGAVKISYENGKLAKLIVFDLEIPDPIPSPFDDISFSDFNFRPKSEFAK